MTEEGVLPDGKGGGGGGEPAIGNVDEGNAPFCCSSEEEDVAAPVVCNAYPQLPQKVLRESMGALHFGQLIGAIYILLQIIK